MKNSISIIIPIHNGETYLRQCLKSVINQTLKNIEVICVNDGSSDNSANILKEFQEIDSRIIVISQEASNAGHARNVGLSKATGKYISFLDCDDWFELDMQEKMFQRAEQTNADVVICKAVTFDQQQKKSTLKSFSLQENLLPSKEIFSCKDIAKDAFQFCRTAAWDKLYKKSFIDCYNLKFQEQPRMNDCFFSVMANIKANRITICNEYFVHYRINTGHSITSNAEQTYPCTIATINLIKDSLTQSEYALYEVSFKNFAIKIIFYEFLRFSPNVAYKYYTLFYLIKKHFESLRHSEIYNPDLYNLLKKIIFSPKMSKDEFEIEFENFQRKYHKQRDSRFFFIVRRIRSILVLLQTKGFVYFYRRIKSFFMSYKKEQ